jgi:hypothetical protein
MAQSFNSPLHLWEPTASIESLYFSVRTYNRLRKMRIDNLEQIARTPPREFLAINGFGKKCLYELSETLERFYSNLDIHRLGSFANVVELWRPYFPHPDRVPVMTNQPESQDVDQLVAGGYEAAIIATQPFEPDRNSMAQLRVQDLPISTRARNVLRDAGIRTVDELAQIAPGTLIKVGNCGRRTIAELAKILGAYFASLPNSGIAFYRGTRPSWLRHVTSSPSSSEHSLSIFLQPEERAVMEVIENALTTLRPRMVSILVKRMGVAPGQPRKTLEAIGREFDLTRERVRQIVDKGLQIISRNVRTLSPNTYPSIRTFIRTQKVVSVDDVIGSIPNLGSSPQFDSKSCIRLLLFGSQDDSHPLDARGNVWCSKEITPEFHRRVVRAARRILKGIPMTCADLSVEIAKSLRQFDDTQVKTIQKLLLNSPTALRIEHSPGGEILHPPRQNSSDRRRAFIYTYIKEQGVPVHIQELFGAIQDSMPELIPDSPTRKSAINTIASGMERDDRFAWAGSSTWGLREWGYASRGASIAAAVLEVLRAAGAPLSAAQITKELSHLYRITRSGVSVALKSAEGVTIEKDRQGLWRPI